MFWILNANKNTNSTSTSTGGVVIDGGVGIGLSMHIGGDIVGELVENNKKKFKQKFIITDLRYDKIIPCDLLFVRECFNLILLIQLI